MFKSEKHLCSRVSLRNLQFISENIIHRNRLPSLSNLSLCEYILLWLGILTSLSESGISGLIAFIAVMHFYLWHWLQSTQFKIVFFIISRVMPCLKQRNSEIVLLISICQSTERYYWVLGHKSVTSLHKRQSYLAHHSSTMLCCCDDINFQSTDISTLLCFAVRI